MFQSSIKFDDSGIQSVHKELDNLATDLQNKAIKPAVAAACKPIERTYASLVKRSKLVAPTRRLRGTNVYVDRPHLKDSTATKIWRIPDGSGYVGIVGPRSVVVPHYHLYESGTGPRKHKSGHPTGSMPASHAMQRAYAQSLNEAEFELRSTLVERIVTLRNYPPSL